MNRRGGAEFGGEKLVDIVLSLLVVGSIIFIAILFWRSFNAVDMKARNEVRLVADLMQSLIDDPDPHATREMFFDMSYKRGTILAKRDKFKGVFFAMYPEDSLSGESSIIFTAPQPPPRLDSNPGTFTSFSYLVNIAGSQLQAAVLRARDCGSTGENACLEAFWEEHCSSEKEKGEFPDLCLCFSKVWTGSSSVPALSDHIISGIVECHALYQDDSLESHSLLAASFRPLSDREFSRSRGRLSLFLSKKFLPPDTLVIEGVWQPLEE